MSDRFVDYRGIIQDLITTELDSVTEIFTVKGAVRGNHVHDRTTQWTYIVSGRMQVATREGISHLTRKNDYGPGELFCEEPGIAHAWRALEDTTVLVFTRGPRSGEAYESDTRRLEIPLI